VNFPPVLEAKLVGAFKLGTPPPSRRESPVLRRRIPSRGASSSDVLLVGEAPNSPSRSTVAPNGDACRAAASLPPVAPDWVSEVLLSVYEALFRFVFMKE
jgi:hypothetical protein